MPGLGDRYYLYPYLARLAVSGGRYQSYARNVDETHFLTRTGAGCADDGRVATKTGRRGYRAFVPGQLVRQL